MIADDNRVTLRANGKNCSSASPHSSSEIRGMFAALRRLGYDLDSLLAAAGLSRADIEDLDTPIRSDACAMVLAKAQQQGRVKNLALRLALEMPIGSNPLLDYIIASSESVGDGLQRLARYLRLVNPAISIDLRDRQEPIQVIVDRADPFGDELCVSLSVLRMRSETRDGLKAEFVSFRHEPDDAAEYASMLGSPVYTRSSWSGWSLSRAAWSLPLRRCDPVLRNWLEGRAAQILSRGPIEQSLKAEVCRLLATRMAEGDMRIGVLARHLAMTPRTLQRRLAQEGTSFDVLRDSVRMQAAETLLSDPAVSVGEVAYLLGYSESAAFHRAFRRWYGAAPRTFRQQRQSSTVMPGERR